MTQRQKLRWIRVPQKTTKKNNQKPDDTSASLPTSAPVFNPPDPNHASRNQAGTRGIQGRDCGKVTAGGAPATSTSCLLIGHLSSSEPTAPPFTLRCCRVSGRETSVS